MMKESFFNGLAVLLLSVTIGLGPTGSVMAQTSRQNPLLFEVLQRLDLLEQEVRQLRGDLEMYRYRQEQLQRQSPSSKHVETGAEAQVTGNGTREATGAEPRTDTQAAAPALPPSGREQATYDSAIRELQDGRYEEAIAGLQGFLAAYPDSSLAGNAYYWLGESYYVTRDLSRAKVIFNSLGAKYPNHEKIPEALLKLSYVYSEQDDALMAREMLENLIQRYPNASAAITARKRLESIR
jgi:tol-pal system protein YbgF